ncbi:MAG TPA: sodium/proton-translocating pyrophosphatase, partial [Roseiflexaceae bacterium]|nr:sodium/proton-translocating pyrophosphatase [Roseiflexaceae bacterium]
MTLIAPISGVLALLVAGWNANTINRSDAGSARMQEIASAIQQGAQAFLSSEYRVLALFVGAVTLLIAAVGFVSSAMHPLTAVAFLAGAGASVLAGYIGMRVATRANVRTAQAAHHGMAAALRVAFSGGAVMGLCVVGLG